MREGFILRAWSALVQGTILLIALILMGCGQYQSKNQEQFTPASTSLEIPTFQENRQITFKSQHLLFEDGKIQLEESEEAAIESALATLSSGNVLTANTLEEMSELKIKLTYDNLCIAEKMNSGDTDDLLISKEAIENQVIEDLSLQSFGVIFSDLLPTDDLELAAENDECLIGITRDHQIELLNIDLVRSELEALQVGSFQPVAAWNHLYQLFADSQLATQTVAVIDTGVNVGHDELAGKLWTDENGNHGYNVISRSSSDQDLYDFLNHGTPVAGLIAARANASGIAGIAGIRKAAEIMTVNVFGNNPSTSNSHILNGIRWAMQNGADIINLSLGGGPENIELTALIQDAVSSGIFVALASGNSGNAIPMWPARAALSIDGAMAVGATQPTDQGEDVKAEFSSARSEIYARGLGVTSLQNIGGIGGNYAGTSFSSPLIAGLAALMRAYENGQGREVEPSEIESRILATDLETNSLDLDGTPINVAQAGQAMKFGFNGEYPSEPPSANPTPLPPSEEENEVGTTNVCLVTRTNGTGVIEAYGTRAHESESRCKFYASGSGRRFISFGSPEGSKKLGKCHVSKTDGTGEILAYGTRAHESEKRCKNYAAGTGRIFRYFQN